MILDPTAIETYQKETKVYRNGHNGHQNSRSPKRKKIAVLGGGIAALTTALAMTDEKDWQKKYDITVYQMGWRLGGKGASGRNPEIADRIEEHGLHIWFGFYENAFRLMRKAYAELGRDLTEPMATWQDAFKPHSLVTLQENVKGEWKTWAMDMPRNHGLPGDGGPESNASDWVRGLLQASRTMIKMMLSYGLITGHNGVDDSLAKNLGRTSFSSIAMLLHLAEKAGSETAGRLGRIFPFGNGTTSSAILDTRRIISESLHVRIEQNDELRRMWITLDLTLTVLYGILKDKLLERGFDAIDHFDFAEWLAHHGASPMTVRSAPVRGVYDLAFAYEDGDINRPNFAAGTALYGYLRGLFSYKGAFMWKMQAGMGDIVFTPIYEVLKRRGVHFKFFHRIENLKLSKNKQHVEKILVARQATVKNGEYQPLMDVKGLPSWPDRPFYDQLVEGEEIKEKGINLESSWSPWEPVEVLTLKKGRDFDDIVLGISIAALPYVAGEIIESRLSWQRMIEHVKTVQTLAIQTWFRPSAREMGWTASTQLDEEPIQGAYVEPIDTWADLTHLEPAENWPAEHQPGHIAYFCGPLNEPGPIEPFSEHDFPEREKARVKEMARGYFENDAAYLWPAAVEANGNFDWNTMVDMKNRSGVERMEAQYFRANVEPTERYVLSLKGSTRYRLRPDQSGVDNLFLTGDWTDNGINSGCIEAAVTSGLMCARAVTGQDIFIAGEVKKAKTSHHWDDHYQVLSDCPHCGIEGAVVEWIDPYLPLGTAVDTTCRFCHRQVRGGLVVNEGIQFPDQETVLEALAAWAKEEGTDDVHLFARANFQGLSAGEVAQRVILKRPVSTSFNALNWLLNPEMKKPVVPEQGNAKVCKIATESALIAARSLTTLALVDGSISDEDSRFISRFLEKAGYPPLKAADLRPWLPNDLQLPCSPEPFLEAMLALAWADHEMTAREWQVIKEYAVAWGYSLDKLEQLNSEMEKSYAPLMRRLWLNLRTIVRIGEGIPEAIM